MFVVFIVKVNIDENTKRVKSRLVIYAIAYV